MTTTPKRKVGRPRKVVEEVNPDHEPATKGYVKCLGRTYHTKQTQYILEHRRESSMIHTIVWVCICIGAGVWYGITRSNLSMVALSVSLAFAFNSVMTVSGYSDTINNSCREGIGFLKEYKCEPKKEKCE